MCRTVETTVEDGSEEVTSVINWWRATSSELQLSFRQHKRYLSLLAISATVPLHVLRLTMWSEQPWKIISLDLSSSSKQWAKRPETKHWGLSRHLWLKPTLQMHESSPSPAREIHKEKEHWNKKHMAALLSNFHLFITYQPWLKPHIYSPSVVGISLVTDVAELAMAQG